jgi:hypothetical protein
MTIKGIIDEMEATTNSLFLIFKSFSTGVESEWTRSQEVVYPNVFAIRPQFSSFDNQGITYIVPVIFSDRSIEGLENALQIHSTLNNSMLIWCQQILNNFDNLDLSCVMSDFVHDQEGGLDRCYYIRAEFKVFIPIALCTDIINFVPECTPIPPPPVCNVVLNNVQVFVVRSVLLTIQTTFTSIVGLDYFEIYLSNSLQPFTLVNVDNTPQLINVFGLPFQGPDTYNVRIIWYDNCGNSQSQDFGPFILP